MSRSQCRSRSIDENSWYTFDIEETFTFNLVVERSSKKIWSYRYPIMWTHSALDLTHDPFAFSLLSLRHPSIQLSPRQFSAQPTFHQPSLLTVSQKRYHFCASLSNRNSIWNGNLCLKSQNLWILRYVPLRLACLVLLVTQYLSFSMYGFHCEVSTLSIGLFSSPQVRKVSGQISCWTKFRIQRAVRTTANSKENNATQCQFLWKENAHSRHFADCVLKTIGSQKRGRQCALHILPPVLHSWIAAETIISPLSKEPFRTLCMGWRQRMQGVFDWGGMWLERERNEPVWVTAWWAKLAGPGKA